MLHVQFEYVLTISGIYKALSYYATAMARFASMLRRRNVDPGPRWIRDLDVDLVGGSNLAVDDDVDTGKGDGFGHVMMVSLLVFAVVLIRVVVLTFVFTGWRCIFLGDGMVDLSVLMIAVFVVGTPA